MGKVSRQNIIETLKLDIALGCAAYPALADLAENARLQRFEKGEYIFNVGDESNNFFMVESGRVILSKEAPSGKIFTFLVAVRGTPLNAVACFKPRPRFFSARAAKKTTVIAIPSSIFKQWVLNNPDVNSAIINTMGDMLNGSYTRILDLIDESVEQRVLNALNMLSSRFGPNLPMTNNDIAEMTGTSWETATRVISRLREAGLLSKSRGQIKILDMPQLDGMSTSPAAIFMRQSVHFVPYDLH